LQWKIPELLEIPERGSTAEENIHKMVDFPANYR
jgi:hypothetical protein